MPDFNLKEASASDDSMVVFGRISPGYKNILKNPNFETRVELKEIKEIEVNSLDKLTTDLEYTPTIQRLSVPGKVEDEKEVIRTEAKSENFAKRKVEYLSHRFSHEGKHDDVSKLENQYYLLDKLGSFDMLLLFLDERATKENLIHSALKTAGGITSSRMTQEGAAISAQRGFLQGYHDSEILDLYQAIRDISYRTTLRRNLNSNEKLSNEELLGKIKYPTHAFADFLYSEAQRKWDIDILEYAFRSHLTQQISRPSEVEIPQFSLCNADSILIASAVADETEINRCSTIDEEEKLLKRYTGSYMKSIGEFPSRLTHDSRMPTLHYITDSGLKISNRDEIEKQHWRLHQHLEEQYETQFGFGNVNYLRPLRCLEYPGLKQGRNLWRILEAMYVVIERSDDRFRKSLWIDKDVWGWAHTTELYQLAVKLWEYREELYIPLVQVGVKEMTWSWTSLLETIRTGVVDDSKRVFTAPKYENSAMPKYLNQIGSEKPKYKELLQELNLLGTAIKHGNERKIKNFL